MTSQVTNLEDEDLPAVAVKDAAPALAPVSVGSSHADEKLSGKKVTLTIFSGDGDINKIPVFMGLNGYGYQIPRDVPSVVPVELLEVLKNAEVDTFSYKDNQMVRQRIKRFNFQAEPYEDPAPAASEPAASEPKAKKAEAKKAA